MTTIVQRALKFECPACGAPAGLDCRKLPALEVPMNVPHAQRYNMGKNAK